MYKIIGSFLPIYLCFSAFSGDLPNCLKEMGTVKNREDMINVMARYQKLDDADILHRFSRCFKCNKESNTNFGLYRLYSSLLLTCIANGNACADVLYLDNLFVEENNIKKSKSIEKLVKYVLSFYPIPGVCHFTEDKVVLPKNLKKEIFDVVLSDIGQPENLSKPLKIFRCFVEYLRKKVADC